jgi:ArsR family transcriptional regulator
LIYKRKLCVNEIAVALNMTNSAVSHQLKNLKQSRLVKSEKQGKEVYYTLEDEHIEKIFKLSLEHIEEGKNNE